VFGCRWGDIAARKTEQLLKADAKVTAIAPKINTVLNKLAQDKRITFLERGYEQADIENMTLVIAATDDSELNKFIAGHAKSKQIMVNVADNPDAGTFIMPSVIDRNPVMISVSTELYNDS
jgi:uroporphyrin-III C-methyltransferase / precorrin-2 dehydrogenase / sirohydrochlorin ferrochelatase